jgi:hypothetical protein
VDVTLQHDDRMMQPWRTAAIVAVAVAAVAGPPLVSWLVDSVNQAGSTPADTTDEPVEQSIDDLLQDGPAAGLDAIDDAKQVVGDTTP